MWILVPTVYIVINTMNIAHCSKNSVAQDIFMYNEKLEKRKEEWVGF